MITELVLSLLKEVAYDEPIIDNPEGHNYCYYCLNETRRSKYGGSEVLHKASCTWLKIFNFIEELEKLS